GSVTVKATGRGPHKTVHYAHGYDNRTTTMLSGVTNANGTIQLVTPVITRRLVSAAGFDFETSGIGILRIKFIGSGLDFDGDGVADSIDNCSVRANPDQVDTDGDDCGNLCDADYTQDGTVDQADLDFFGFNCGPGSCNQLCQHTPPINSATCSSIGDFGFLSQNLGLVPGPSGTTAGTVACPIPLPEPSSTLLLSAGLAFLLTVGRRRMRRIKCTTVMADANRDVQPGDSSVGAARRRR
ncbi:MAG: thrombospondin type 3 repeat-containing protein, partial [Myxococcales bacterium]|nr:thrombospondin type 3 repeat-containing protein [Myxococcales bacterium]